MKATICLEDEMLCQLVEGGGSAQDMLAAEDHVLTCPHCLERLKEFADSSDSWPQPASAAPAGPEAVLISRLAALRPCSG